MTDKTDLREKLNIPILDTTNEAESFQNQILRPILKLQNGIFLMLFREYALRKNSDFDGMKMEQKLNFTDQSLQKDHALRNIFIGMTIGMLTQEEMKLYLSDTRSFNKRIIAMLTERIKSQLDTL